MLSEISDSTTRSGRREFLRVRLVILLHFVTGNVHVRADFAPYEFLLEQPVANGGLIIFPSEAGSFDASFQIIEGGKAVFLAHFVETLVQIGFDADAHGLARCTISDWSIMPRNKSFCCCLNSASILSCGQP